MRIAHLSDLHCPAREPAQEDALIASVRDGKPDLVIVSGDLTHVGAEREFRHAAALLGAIGAPLLAVPGNHDIPEFRLDIRLLDPFGRFRRFLGATTPHFVNGEVVIAGLNTARGVQWRFDWSLGHVKRTALKAAAHWLGDAPHEAIRIAVAHHPLLSDSRDAQRSRTRHGPDAFEILADAGMNVLLHGHLHLGGANRIEHAAGGVVVIGASTALGDRERNMASGYNWLDTAQKKLRLTPMIWNGASYRAEAITEFDFSHAKGA